MTHNFFKAKAISAGTDTTKIQYLLEVHKETRQTPGQHNNTNVNKNA